MPRKPRAGYSHYRRHRPEFHQAYELPGARHTFMPGTPRTIERDVMADNHSQYLGRAWLGHSHSRASTSRIHFGQL